MAYATHPLEVQRSDGLGDRCAEFIRHGFSAVCYDCDEMVQINLVMLYKSIGECIFNSQCCLSMGRVVFRNE